MWKDQYMFYRAAVSLFSLSLGMSVCASIAQAQRYEKSPAYNTVKLLGANAKGSNYTIDNPVKSDGYLNIYHLRVKNKRYRVVGNELLRSRLYDLRVLQRLDRMSAGDELVKGVGDAVIAPLKFAGRIVTSPIDTVGQTLSGVGSFFGRIASGVNNIGSDSPDGTFASVLGVSEAKRTLAKKFGVDPYTDFDPLARRLTELAEASAAGQLVVKGALAVVTGGAAVAISGVSTASSIRSLIYDKTASQIRDINRNKLKALKFNARLIKLLLDNRNYTVTSRSVLIEAFQQLRQVKGLVIFAARAARVNSHGLAFFIRRRAELLADYHRTEEQLTSFVSFLDFPLTITRSGRVLALFPMDNFSWTQRNARIITAITEEIRDKHLKKGAEFRTTGWTTVLAEKMLKSQGWSVTRVGRR